MNFIPASARLQLQTRTSQSQDKRTATSRVPVPVKENKQRTLVRSVILLDAWEQANWQAGEPSGWSLGSRGVTNDSSNQQVSYPTWPAWVSPQITLVICIPVHTRAIGLASCWSSSACNLVTSTPMNKDARLKAEGKCGSRPPSWTVGSRANV